MADFVSVVASAVDCTARDYPTLRLTPFAGAKAAGICSLIMQPIGVIDLEVANRSDRCAPLTMGKNPAALQTGQEGPRRQEPARPQC
jgi:hypothetical protein